MGTIDASVLKIVVTNSYNDNQPETWEGYEFKNGLVMLPGVDAADQYYESKETIELFDYEKIQSITIAGVEKFCHQDFLDSIYKSFAEYGEDSVPAKWRELTL